MKKDMGGARPRPGRRERDHGHRAPGAPARPRPRRGEQRLRQRLPPASTSCRRGRERRSRSGNTDAEGRVILADAPARSLPPSLRSCSSTSPPLTGAARIALGNRASGALRERRRHGPRRSSQRVRAVQDPLWRMPLWQPYPTSHRGQGRGHHQLPPTRASAAPSTAALFLQEFVEPSIAWAHIDVMAWNTSSRPGRPEGGEAMGMRAVLRAHRGSRSRLTPPPAPTGSPPASRGVASWKSRPDAPRRQEPLPQERAQHRGLALDSRRARRRGRASWTSRAPGVVGLVSPGPHRRVVGLVVAELGEEDGPVDVSRENSRSSAIHRDHPRSSAARSGSLAPRSAGSRPGSRPRRGRPRTRPGRSRPQLDA